MGSSLLDRAGAELTLGLSMNRCMGVIGVGLTLLVVSCNPLEKAKREVLAKYEGDAELVGLLSDPALRRQALKWLPRKSAFVIDLPETAITVEAPLTVEEEKGVRQLSYEGLVVLAFFEGGESTFGELPSEWGEGDYGKLRTILATNRVDLEEATTELELQDATSRLAFKSMLMPFGGWDGLREVKGAGFVGLLSGDPSRSQTMELYFRPDHNRHQLYRLTFKHLPGGNFDGVERFLGTMSLLPANGDLSVQASGVALEEFWQAWWKFAGPEEFAVPVSEPFEGTDFLGQDEVVFRGAPSEDSPNGFLLHLAADFTGRFSGIGEGGSPWENLGRWRFEQGRLYLFFSESGIPAVVFMEAGQVYLTDPFSTTLRSELTRLGRPVSPRDGQPALPGHSP